MCLLELPVTALLLPFVCKTAPLLPVDEVEVEAVDGHWKLLGDAFRRDEAGMNSGDWGVT